MRILGLLPRKVTSAPLEYHPDSYLGVPVGCVLSEARIENKKRHSSAKRNLGLGSSSLSPIPYILQIWIPRGRCFLRDLRLPTHPKHKTNRRSRKIKPEAEVERILFKALFPLNASVGGSCDSLFNLDVPVWPPRRAKVRFHPRLKCTPVPRKFSSFSALTR